MPKSPRSSPEPSDEQVIQHLTKLYPPLERYCPNLGTISAPQAAFLLLDLHEIREAFYGGAAGGGKSDALLMAALMYVDVAGYNALLLRRTFPELEGAEGLIARAHEWLAPFRQNGELSWNEQKHRWTFPSGATVQFGHVNEENDKYRYQGQAYQFVGFDELTHFTETQYDYIAFTRSRRLERMKEIGVPVRARAASNPGNIGHGWVLKRFPIPTAMHPERIPEDCDGRIFIPARIQDNPGLDVEDYEASMQHLPAALRAQLRDGDWGAFEGMAFEKFRADPEAQVHVVEPFEIPADWDRAECMDYGLNNPTAWHVFALDYERNHVFFGSHYKPGLPSDTAAVIRKLRGVWGSSLAYGDPSSLRTRTGTFTRWGEQATIGTEFEDNGIPLVAANNDPRAGYTRLRELIEPDPERRFPDWHPRRGEYGAPRLFIVQGACPELVEQLQTAPLQPLEKRWAGEMIDPEWESAHGHAVAAARYGVMSWPAASEKPGPQEPDDPRAAFMQRALRDRDDHPKRRRFLFV